MKRTLAAPVGPSNPRQAQWSFWVAALILSGCVFCGNSFGQGLHREWVRTYSLDATKVNQASAIAVAPDGNIVVAGVSENPGGDLDYEVIKYQPNGDVAWTARYGSANSGNDQFRAMVVDPSGNIIVTGTTDTVKLSSAGKLLWSVPLPCRAITANTQFIYVAGFPSADIATAQLENNDTDGKENWRKLVDGRNHGVDIGEVITLDKEGNVYVAGNENYSPCDPLFCHNTAAVVSYTPAGIQRFFGDAAVDGSPSPYGQSAFVNAQQVLVTQSGSIYVYAMYNSDLADLVKFDGSGHYLNGIGGMVQYFGSVATKAIPTANGGIIAAGSHGSAAVLTSFTPELAYSQLWSYSVPNGLSAQANDILRDSPGTLYVTGYSDHALFLARVTQTGQTLGLDRFNGTNAVRTAGIAMTLDSSDNVYVTGYVANTQGGSEFVTIKYAATPPIQRNSDGSMHLEFYTSPGQTYAIEATTDFFNWQGVITNTADANGLILFDDTNAVTVPYRFYRGNAAP